MNLLVRVGWPRLPARPVEGIVIAVFVDVPPEKLLESPCAAVEDVHSHLVAKEKQSGTALVGLTHDPGDQFGIPRILRRLLGCEVLAIDPSPLPHVEPVKAVTASGHNPYPLFAVDEQEVAPREAWLLTAGSFLHLMLERAGRFACFRPEPWPATAVEGHTGMKVGNLGDGP